ncbi:hypothetical protein AsAng_0043590 [Aureispira anguillae]|uniref:Uncharacterized protein n=1 Tax=Aureispira anguillae TaxID=2864201 RepID=A0A915YIE2_9BACT|nr:hypothetical protein AsAng_0043590 [Aureispira anguillae]
MEALMSKILFSKLTESLEEKLTFMEHFVIFDCLQ